MSESECECGHPWSSHTSGGICAGREDVGHCYCCAFPPDPPERGAPMIEALIGTLIVVVGGALLAWWL